MAWGGGAPAGSPFGGPPATSSSAAAGLPFAGVPEELRERAERIVGAEPAHPAPVVAFDPAHWDRRPFTLRRLFRPHTAGLVGALVLVVVETLAMQAGPLLTQRGIDHGILRRDTGELVAVAAAFVVSVLVGTGASAWRIAWTGRLGETLLYELRLRVFSHLQRLSVDYYTGERSGRIMTRMTSDIEALSALFQDGIVNLAVQALTMLVVTVVLFFLDARLALVTIGAVVPAMAVLTLWFRGASDRTYNAVRERIAEVLADLAENLAGIRVVTAHNRRRHNVVAHRNVTGRYRDANTQTAFVGAIYGPGGDLIGVLGQVAVLAMGGHMVLSGDLMIGELTAFVLYLTAFFAPIQQLVQLYTTYQSGQAAVGKLRELLATEPTVAERPDAVPLGPIEGRITFEEVRFRYEPDAPLVLDGVTLEVPAGQTFAFVGTTGAGKSTLAKLVVRFHDPTEGRVCIDGTDLRDVTLASLRHQLGVVPQEPFLFAGTVRDNLTFASPGATDAEVDETVRAVGLDDLVARLADGVDTVVHERGTSLSSGERQLLALGRAFLARPRVLVLDEATSSLDLRSEAQVERALDRVLEGRTAIIIAHRLATAMRAHRIAVVEHGHIVEIGSHDELVALGGRYAAMYATWAAHAEHG